MSPEERSTLEARADKLVRRGEMAMALELLGAVAKAFPGDPALARRLGALSDALQPSELQNPKATLAQDPAGADADPEQEGERLFAQGDFAGAIGAYRRALRERPDSELVRERLEELFHLAQARPGRPSSGLALPLEREARLDALLERISARRRL